MVRAMWSSERLILLLIGSFWGMLHSMHAQAQSNGDLQHQRLISAEVRQVLDRHGATTQFQRVEVLDQACRTGELSLAACQSIGRGPRSGRR